MRHSDILHFFSKCRKFDKIYVHLQQTHNTMTELFVHHIWQYQLFDRTDLYTTIGEPLEIIQIGSYNIHAGPDFLNAKIKIGSTIWVGNIEIHVNASDWNNHKHYLQKEYNSVILHVVVNNDKEIVNEQGASIPTFIIPIDKKMQDSYECIENCSISKSCATIFPSIDIFYAHMWYDRLLIERYESKATKIITDYERNNNSWEVTCYKSIVRALGSPLNTLPFEMLSNSVDLKIISKHASSRFELESLLLGQAGFLTPPSTDAYIQKMQHEYAFLQKKYTLTTLHASIWKFSKMRPSHFPTIRIAQLCEIICRSRSLTSHILECTSLTQIFELFSCTLHDFWDTHYTLQEESPYLKKQLGKQTLQSIAINAIIPFLFAYGSKTEEQVYKDRALEFLEELPSEQNTIISTWEDLGIQSHSAYRSQALIQLHNLYCLHCRCLQCAFGHVYFKHLLQETV